MHLVCQKGSRINVVDVRTQFFLWLNWKVDFCAQNPWTFNSDVWLGPVWHRSRLNFMCFKSNSFCCPSYVCMFQSNVDSLLVSLIQLTAPHSLCNVTGLNVHVICLKVLWLGYDDIGLCEISYKTWYQLISVNPNVKLFDYNTSLKRHKVSSPFHNVITEFDLLLVLRNTAHRN
jgi:hypothetical protein